MIYEIQSKSDFSTGTSLIVKIPEDMIDNKALYTIQWDTPEFILPFRHRRVDGQIEFVYQLGMSNKLQYLSGSYSPQEYAELWSSILNPLLDCGDWFMNPLSFVLQAEHLYYDKSSKTVRYVYVPSSRECSDYNDLREMAVELSKLISVTDTNLENKVLWAIMNGFKPKEFMQILQPYLTAKIIEEQPIPKPQPVPELPREVLQPASVSVPEPAINQTPVDMRDALNEMDLNIAGSGKPAKKDKREKPPKAGKEKPPKVVKEKPKGKGIFGGKKEKEPPKPKASGGLFGKKKDEPQEIILGAAANHENVQPIVQPVAQPAIQPVMPVHTPPAEFDEVTQLDSGEMSRTMLRLVGNASLPGTIDVNVASGGVFTIGRFDVSVGRQQSSFEFDKTTKAVSRRHAAIKRDADGYSIIDLSSTAGTFVNGQKLPPNLPKKLERGCRVSFGNSGADYVWEE